MTDRLPLDNSYFLSSRSSFWHAWWSSSAAGGTPHCNSGSCLSAFGLRTWGQDLQRACTRRCSTPQGPRRTGSSCATVSQPSFGSSRAAFSILRLCRREIGSFSSSCWSSDNLGLATSPFVEQLGVAFIFELLTWDWPMQLLKLLLGLSCWPCRIRRVVQGGVFLVVACCLGCGCAYMAVDAAYRHFACICS